MVLAGQDQAFHSRGLNAPDPLVRVQRRRTEYGGAFGSVAPFPVREGIDRKVYEGIKLHLLQGDLAGGGNDLNQLFICHFSVFSSFGTGWKANRK